MKDTKIGVDLAKRVFQVHGASMTGQVRFLKKLTREQFRRFMANQPACIIVFEACGSAQGVYNNRRQDGAHGPCDRQERRTSSSLLQVNSARREDPSLMRP